MKLTCFFFLFFTAVSFNVSAQSSIDKLLSRKNTGSVPYISVEELKMKKQDQDLVILDAREKEEYEISHISNAHFVGYSNFSSEEFSHIFTNKSTTIVVYCSVGIRSETISEKLAEAGYKNVYNLYGGIFKWKNTGYVVFDNHEDKTEKIHTFSKYWAKYLEKGIAVY